MGTSTPWSQKRKTYTDTHTHTQTVKVYDKIHFKFLYGNSRQHFGKDEVALLQKKKCSPCLFLCHFAYIISREKEITI